MKSLHNKINTHLALIILLFLVGQFSFSCMNISSKSFKSLNTQLTCSDKVLNFNGKCMTEYLILDGLNIPKAANSFIVPILKNIASNVGMDGCLGDYKGDVIEESKRLGDLRCQGFPLPKDGTYGVLAAYVKNMVCGSPVNVRACVVFDDCGSVVISVNGGTATCAATYATGIAAVISPLAGLLDQMSIGFSLTRRFTNTFTVSAKDEDAINARHITTRGHFYFGLDTTLILDLQIFGRNLKDFIDVSSSTKVLVDFGDLGNAVKDFVSTLSDGKPNRETLDSIMNIGGEMTLTVESKMTLKIGKLTKDLFDDLELELGMAYVLVTKGGNNASGMPLGIYFNFTNSVLKNMLDIFDKFLDSMTPILEQIGFKKSAMPQGDSSFGGFISKEATGFEFNFPGLYIKCIFEYNNQKAGCQFGSKFFTANIDGENWVVKSATKFFDDRGKEILRFASDAGRFSRKMAMEFALKSQQAAKLAADQAQKFREEAEKAARKAKEEAEKAKKAIFRW